MNIRLIFVAALVWAMACAPGAGVAADAGPQRALGLSPEVTALLRAEMAGLSEGMASIALALPRADWKSIRETGERMQGSYVMKQSLTEEQALELETKLPGAFKQLDADFHARAGKLAHAAAAEDFELAAFHYARLIETCARCHAAYARDRFPGFGSGSQSEHRH